MIQIGHYRIKGGIKDTRRYKIYADTKENYISLQIQERKETNGVQEFAFKVTGLAGMQHLYTSETTVGFVGWKIPPDKLSEFLNTFQNFMYERYHSFRLHLDHNKIKDMKVLAKI